MSPWTARRALAIPALSPAVSPVAIRSTRADLPKVNLRQANLDAVTEQHCVDYVMSRLRDGCGGSVITMNLDHLRRHSRDAAYAECTRRATILTADGMPLIWASRLQRTPLPERVTGSNLIWSLSAAAASEGRSVLLLGGSPGTAVGAASALRTRYPRLQVTGVHGGQVDPTEGAVPLSGLARAVRAVEPDIVFVGLGSPKQEVVIDRLREEFPQCWWLGVGIAFSFVSGEISRAPIWVQRTGLEWLHRLAQEPRRLARRYLVEDLPFAMRLFAGSVQMRYSGKASRPIAKRPQSTEIR